MRASTAYFAGAGTVVGAVVVGLGGGLMMANIVSPHTPKHGTEMSKPRAAHVGRADPCDERAVATGTLCRGHAGRANRCGRRRACLPGSTRSGKRKPRLQHPRLNRPRASRPLCPKKPSLRRTKTSETNLFSDGPNLQTLQIFRMLPRLPPTTPSPGRATSMSSVRPPRSGVASAVSNGPRSAGIRGIRNCVMSSRRSGKRPADAKLADARLRGRTGAGRDAAHQVLRFGVRSLCAVVTGKADRSISSGPRYHRPSSDCFCYRRAFLADVLRVAFGAAPPRFGLAATLAACFARLRSRCWVQAAVRP